MLKRKRKCKRTEWEKVKTEKNEKEKDKGREEEKMKSIGNIEWRKNGNNNEKN